MNYLCSIFSAISYSTSSLIYLALTLTCLTTTAVADSNQTAANQVAVHQDPAAGSFMLRAGSADYAPALLLGTDVVVEITGPIAKVVVRQQFYNQSSDYVEGKYVFPLPENAAVNAMSLQIGERIIKGQVQEKQEAQKTYAKALAAGKTAGLLEQRRPNLFTTKVGNIAPKEVVLVELTYLQTVARLGNEFSFNFPMTLTPRYTPENFVPTEEPLGAQFIFAQQLPAELANPVRIRVRLNDQEGLSAIHSDSHDITEKQVQKNQQQAAHWAIATKNMYVPMDRDFTLQWRLGSDTDASPAFFIDKLDGDYYGLIMLMPPANPNAAAVLAREIIFVIDTSGSMSGASIEQAKASLQFAIAQLSPQQRFNIIEFNSDYQQLFAEPYSATAAAKQQAKEFVQALQADGGTEMAPALRAALTMPSAPEYLRQVIFMTDGAVSNEDELFGIMQQLLGESRLFTLGIGSAPNSYFMKKAAQLGRGTETKIQQLSDVDEVMRGLFTQLERPLLKDIKIHLPADIQAEIYPQKIPDLYAGEPLLLSIKFNGLPKTLSLSGQAQQAWSVNLPAASVNETAQNGVASLWARAKISDLSDGILREGNAEGLTRELIEVALSHQLVSQYTSFVAVEEIISRPENTALKAEQLANLMPHGSTANVIGADTVPYPSTANGVELLWLTGCLLLLLSLGLGCTSMSYTRRGYNSVRHHG